MSDHLADQHDAFREQRKLALYWLRKSTEDLEVLDLVEDIMPLFVRRRYVITGVTRRGDERAMGSLDLRPLNWDEVKDDVKAADALHADVDKLFNFLLARRQDNDNQGLTQERPSRRVVKYNGLITYDFHLTGLPGFEGGLTVIFNGLPAGSACQVTKKVTGTRVVEDVEYEMVCDDDREAVEA